MVNSALVLAAVLFQAGSASSDATKPIIDNEHATVWDTSSPRSFSKVYVAIDLAKGSAQLGKKGTVPASLSQSKPDRTVVIELKDHAVPSAMPNKSGLPNAFPRPGSKKLYETPRIIVWDYTWTTGVATPMHFHDKDVVVTYLKDGTLKSTTPSGEATMNTYSFGTVKFNLKDRTHTETLMQGSQRAIITEFK
jgi:hypothetical protein